MWQEGHARFAKNIARQIPPGCLDAFLFRFLKPHVAERHMENGPITLHSSPITLHQHDRWNHVDTIGWPRWARGRPPSVVGSGGRGGCWACRRHSSVGRAREGWSGGAEERNRCKEADGRYQLEVSVHFGDWRLDDCLE